MDHPPSPILAIERWWYEPLLGRDRLCPVIGIDFPNPDPLNPLMADSEIRISPFGIQPCFTGTRSSGSCFSYWFRTWLCSIPGGSEPPSQRCPSGSGSAVESLASTAPNPSWFGNRRAGSPGEILAWNLHTGSTGCSPGFPSLQIRDILHWNPPDGRLQASLQGRS